MLRSFSLPPTSRSSSAWKRGEWSWWTVWQSSWRMTKSRRCSSSGTGSATGRCARCRSPIWSGWPGSLPNGIADRFALRVPLRGTVVQPPLRAATVPIGGVLLRAKGWGVEVVGRAARLFDPGPSESIRCGFPEIPRPGRDAVRVGEPDGAVRPYAERNAPCPSALREGHLSDYRMDDRLLPADGFSGLGLRFGLSGCRMIRLGAKQAE